MIRIGITGACGRMGTYISEAVSSSDGVSIGALIEKPGSEFIGETRFGVKVSDSLSSVKDSFDVLIDFTNPEHTYKNVELCAEFNKPIVIGTTGLDSNFSKKASELSKKIPILVSSNMSIGVNALHEILKVGAKVLSDYDIEIVEKHHRYKKDAPSGTAISLAKTIYSSLDRESDFEKDTVFTRYGSDIGEREKGTIGIQTVRCGNIVGEHDVIFASNNEVITLSHRAGSRMIFAGGAVKAAKFIQSKSPKLYKMAEVLGL